MGLTTHNLKGNIYKYSEYQMNWITFQTINKTWAEISNLNLVEKFLWWEGV